MTQLNYFIKERSECCKAQITIEYRYNGKEVRAFCHGCKGWLKDFPLSREIIKRFVFKEKKYTYT